VTDTATTAEEIVTANDFVAVCGVALESFTCRVNVKLPDAVGVPFIIEDELFTVSPPGSVPEDTDHV
jgi:hypothetical protein